MGKKSVVGHVRNGMFLTTAVVAMFVASSCKKEASVSPESAAGTASSQSKTTKGSVVAYKASQPISLNGAHDITISGYAINGGAASCIDLTNCYNIHITGCQLQNSDKMGINLAKCSNIIIDNCSMTSVEGGVYSIDGHDVQVHDNKIINLATGGASVTFESVDSGIDAVRSNGSVNNQVQ